MPWKGGSISQQNCGSAAIAGATLDIKPGVVDMPRGTPKGISTVKRLKLVKGSEWFEVLANMLHGSETAY